MLICVWQVTKDIEELNRLSNLASRQYVIQLLRHESEKLQQSIISQVDSGQEQMSTDTEKRCTDATVTSTESSEHSTTANTDAAAVSNPCIAVTRSAPQRYYKEITTYGRI